MTIPFAKELSLSDIMSHIGAVDTVDTRLRCLTEGEAVLKARHIICCGVKTCTETLLTVQGLCVQTSHVQNKPHELEFAYSLDGTIKNGTLATNVTIKWFPAHAGKLDESLGPNRNEEADREAHALTRRGLPPSLPDMREADPTEAKAEDANSEEFAITKYGEVLQWYRASRNKYPPPHRDLTRKEATTFRQLQARAIWTPVWAKHVCQEIYHTDTCQRCKKARATQSHILWERSPPAPNTQDIEMLDKIGNKITSTDLETQRAVFQHVLELLDRQKPETSSRSRGNG
ncbi:hypothetical protein HPB50_028342 [Hyalomma asiaticum]|nr:hypothetical protein HPB50_028342 [Hyalomma asiaticum]